jgi:hypothetical protein
MPEAVRVRLARGSHMIDIAGTLQPDGALLPRWRPTPAAGWEPLPLEGMFVPPNDGDGYGLRETLRAPGVADDESIDPVLAHYFHVSPYTRLGLDPAQWTIQWEGLLDAPNPGVYSFTLDHSHTAQLFLDDQPVNGAVTLEAGRHPIRVEFDKTGEGAPSVSLSWLPPGAPAGVVPMRALSPPPPVVLGAAT